MLMVEKVYKRIAFVLDDGKYGPVPQVKLSSVSIPFNIAEGAGRNSKKNGTNSIAGTQYFERITLY
ncbi:MAG: four helix bundle protein [Flavobacteriaceae bacterium]